jgi:hypothetical protein
MHPDSILQHPAMPASVAGFVGVVALCGGLGFVVQQAVRQGETARRAQALLHEATWRCQTLRDRDSRSACLQRYRAEQPADSERLQAMVADAAARQPRPVR